MKFGANYTPTHDWFHTWLNPDWDSVHRDLEQIASIGMNHVRLFPLWPILQPNRTLINHKGLEDVRRMVEIAGEYGLEAYVDVIQGHLSSFDFMPSWVVTWHDKNMFTDPDTVQGQADLVAALYDELEDVPTFRGLNLGNECNQFLGTRHALHMTATPGEVTHWLESLIAPVKDRAAKRGRVLTHCEDDAVWYLDRHSFNPTHAARIGDITTIHSWVFNGVADRFGASSEQCYRHAQYLTELAKAFAIDPDRKVWVQEIGAPGNVLEQGNEVEFAEQSVRRILECSDVYGITWWCSHDVSSSLADFPVFEHQLGLFNEHGELKDIGRVVRDAIASYDGHEPDRPSAAIVLPDDVVSLDSTVRSSCSPNGAVFDYWMQQAIAGNHLGFVCQSIARDSDALALRGIHECVPFEQALS